MIFNFFIRARVSAGRIGEVFDIKEVPARKEAVKAEEVPKEGVYFNQVSFSYFDTEDYVLYKNISTFGSQNFDGTKETYSLLFNGQPLNNITQTAGRINGDLSLKFYYKKNTNNNENEGKLTHVVNEI